MIPNEIVSHTVKSLKVIYSNSSTYGKHIKNFEKVEANAGIFDLSIYMIKKNTNCKQQTSHHTKNLTNENKGKREIVFTYDENEDEDIICVNNAK